MTEGREGSDGEEGHDEAGWGPDSSGDPEGFVMGAPWELSFWRKGIGPAGIGLRGGHCEGRERCGHGAGVWLHATGRGLTRPGDSTRPAVEAVG